MDARSYSRYQHTLKMAYRLRDVPDVRIAKSFPTYFSIMGLSPRTLVAELAKGSKARLNMLRQPIGHLILDTPSVRTLSFPPHEIMIPLVSQQGVEWYGAAPPSRFDFLVESQLGLLDDAKVIYDFGSRHGIGSMYYALIAGTAGRVVCSEPSIINIEVSALLFLINGANTIVNIGAAVGTNPQRTAHHVFPAGFSESSPASSEISDHAGLDETPVIELCDAAWEQADFLRMDLGGREYDVITRNPWIFDLATHMHIQMHIPRILERGLDYRDIIDLIPFDRFTVFHYQDGVKTKVQATMPLSGLCSLMMKRREVAESA